MSKYKILNGNEICSAARIKYLSNPEPKNMQVRHAYGENPKQKKKASETCVWQESRT